MKQGAAVLGFFRSREGNGWIGILLFAAALAFAASFGFYQASLKSFVAGKIDEKLTAIQLVDSFVGNYGDVRHELAGGAPDEATFRARALERFDTEPGVAKVLRLNWFDRDGKTAIAACADPEMVAIVRSFADEADPSPVTQFLAVDGERVLRTIYPAFAAAA